MTCTHPTPAMAHGTQIGVGGFVMMGPFVDAAGEAVANYPRANDHACRQVTERSASGLNVRLITRSMAFNMPRLFEQASDCSDCPIPLE